MVAMDGCYGCLADVGNFTYGPGHPMKPHRMRMVHNLVVNYGLYSNLHILRPERASVIDMTRFHNDDYIDFLLRVTPESFEAHQPSRYNVGEDCPVFEGLYDFCSISAGGSISAAKRLTSGEAEIAINWSGGLHHAKRGEASGFCYVNDIVLGIIELLRYHQRVLYVDIDIHHGDGVEEAFYTTDRVLTCSFHKFGEYFPGTGDVKDVGISKGKRYAVNFPLRDGIDDETYLGIFKQVIQRIMEWYRPGAIVLQCGADSLAGDRLGCFNLSMKGHAACVEFMKQFHLPMMVVGGGGYTIRNVARTWTYETSVLTGVELSPQIPYNDYFEYYGPDYRLDVLSTNMENHNSAEYLNKIKAEIIENLRELPFAPSVQLQQVPPDRIMLDEDDDVINNEEHEAMDIRITQRQSDARIVPQTELSDSEDEGDQRRNERSYKTLGGSSKRHTSTHSSGAEAQTRRNYSVTARSTLNKPVSGSTAMEEEAMLDDEVLESGML